MADKKVRITKAQRFSDIKAILMGEDTKYTTTLEDAIAFIDRELELLAKKNSKTDSGKSVAEQAQLEQDKADILDYLGTLDPESKGVTCTEIVNITPRFKNNQIVSYLVRQLKAENRVVSQTYKGKTLISLA